MLREKYFLTHQRRDIVNRTILTRIFYDHLFLNVLYHIRIVVLLQWQAI